MSFTLLSLRIFAWFHFTSFVLKNFFFAFFIEANYQVERFWLTMPHHTKLESKKRTRNWSETFLHNKRKPNLRMLLRLKKFLSASKEFLKMIQITGTKDESREMKKCLWSWVIWHELWVGDKSLHGIVVGKIEWRYWASSMK